MFFKRNFLSKNVTILNKKTAASLIVENEQVKGFVTSDNEEIRAEYLIIAPGREGADWLTKEFEKNKIGMATSTINMVHNVRFPIFVCIAKSPRRTPHPGEFPGSSAPP